MKQQTIKKEIRCSGIGLHSGQRVSLILRPADEDSGIVFSHNGPQGRRLIHLSPGNVSSTELATTIGNGRVRISTVEHLLAALSGLGVDNILVEVEGDELPIMDGSAASFVFLIRSVGIRRQRKARKILAFKKSIMFKEDNRWIRVTPYRGMKIKYTIDFDHPMIGKQFFRFEQEPQQFIKSVAKARTFGFLRDVEKLQSMGLALGGSLENAVVLDEYGVVNPGGMRFNDELVRHKVLDFIGDMSLLGTSLWGSFEVHCSGHAFNNSFLRFLDKNQNDYLEPVDFDLQGREQELPQPEAVPQAQPVMA
ncbi:UDP-3-O-acyl-N-acetylglucosamine deacetylase [Desulfonatronovibrio hydrogenovorans]|uniref:UDP-3-O-acyl-N-acetylglucosamine deacetylase n=1 Tax=Desulfonatronovibrio hydrogenovorans TaxID=53245 RepID=UPI000491BF49|nr:UDP-3-O-acyl-N-acetylglucosamine deacetylase [Desulfonatronovibrio hydrogenovorans]